MWPTKHTKLALIWHEEYLIGSMTWSRRDWTGNNWACVRTYHKCTVAKSSVLIFRFPTQSTPSFPPYAIVSSAPFGSWLAGENPVYGINRKIPLPFPPVVSNSLHPSSPRVTKCFESRLLIYSEISLAHRVITAGEQRSQRGSLPSSQAKIPLDSLYRFTTNLIHALYSFWAWGWE